LIGNGTRAAIVRHAEPDGLFSAKAMPPFSLEILKIDRSLAIVPESEPILIRQN
jgi:hypothetical protein